MKKINLINIVFCIFLINLISASGFYYNVNLHYDKGNVEVKKIEIKFSNNDIENIISSRYFKNYSLDVFDIKGEKLDKVYFSVLDKIFYDDVNESEDFVEGGFIEMENSSFNIFIPYYENAKEIVIYNEKDRELVRKDISEFSRGVILDKETKKEKLIGNQRITKGENDREKIKRKIDSNAYLFLTGLLVVLIIVLIYLLRNKGAEKSSK